LQYFKKKAMADLNPQFTIDEDQEMDTQPIYLSSDESEIASPCSSNTPQLPNNVPDTYSAITRLIASHHEMMSLSDNSAPQFPDTPPTSLISDDDGNEELTLFIDTPESPSPENRGQLDNFCPDNLPSQPVSIPLNNPPNIIAVADGMRNLTLHPHPQRNEWVTGCLVCGKPYDQVIEETVADYLHQTAQPGETVRERQIKRNAFIAGVQSGVFTFIPPGVSQAAACDGMLYSVNYSGQDSGAQGYALPLFEG